MVLCRMCETEVVAADFEEHNMECLVTNDFDLKAWQCDEATMAAMRPLEIAVFRVTRARAEAAAARSNDRRARGGGGRGISVPRTQSTDGVDVSQIVDESVYDAARSFINLVRALGKLNNFDAVSLERFDGDFARLPVLQMELEESGAGTDLVEAVRRVSESLRRKRALMQNASTAWMAIHDDEDAAERQLASRNVRRTIPSIKDFEIIKPISRGAFGQVLLAKKKGTGLYYAIKVMAKAHVKNPEHVIAEQRVLRGTSNDFVVKLFYSFESAINLYFVLEFVIGGDCASLLVNCGAFDVDLARFYLAEAIQGLDYLHRNGIVHMDVKPDNMLIAGDGHIKVTDFGLAKRVGEKGGDEGVVGTPGYIAPELIRGRAHDHRVDYWAIGCVLFEFLTGAPPFNGHNVASTLQNTLTGEIPWPAIGGEYMPEDAHDLISRLLRRDPSERPDAAAIRGHPFFRGIRWDALQEMEPPFVPAPDDAEDTSYFDERSDQPGGGAPGVDVDVYVEDATEFVRNDLAYKNLYQLSRENEERVGEC